MELNEIGLEGVRGFDRLARGSMHWLAVVDMIMNLRVP
jgi:hypothetical protein